MVAHGGTSVAGSFIQTLTMVDIVTGWTECLPLVARDGSLVVEAMTRAQSLFSWMLRGADFDNDSAFMNDVVVPWCGAHKIEVTRLRAYKKNDQAFVEQKDGARAQARHHRHHSARPADSFATAPVAFFLRQYVGSLFGVDRHDTRWPNSPVPSNPRSLITAWTLPQRSLNVSGRR